MARKFGVGFYKFVLKFGPAIFFGFDLPPFDHPCHLKSVVPPLGLCH